VPGIVGLITKMPREWAEPQLVRMVAALRHESFYETGTWIEESLGIYVGWAALKNSFADGMPLYNERGDVSLVFSGEEYPDPEVVRRLKQGGHSISQKQSSYLVHLFEEDLNFPACLNGMFHGLVADRTHGTATLFNDRYAMHRVYYHESKEAFYFGGEAKAILAVRPELRTPSSQGLGEFVACSCVLENRTIFKDIHLLPAASAWIFRNATVERKSTYFEPREWEQQASLDPDSYYEELRNTFSRSLQSYFAGPERTGIALTGGMDTRVIMAWHKATSGSLPCYTFGGMFRDCQDVRLARKVASVCQQTHEVIKVGDEFLKRFPHYAERSIYLTEGGVDVYRSSDLYLSEKAREIAPAKVVGTYGSEIVRHAVMFKPMPPEDGLFRPEFLAHVHQAGETYAAVRLAHPVTFAAFRQSPWYHHGILALEQTQLTVRSPYLDNDFVRTVFRAPVSNNGHADIRLRLIADGSPALGRIPSDRGIGGTSGPLVSAIAHRFQEFTFKAEYAYDYGMPQSVASVDHLFSQLHLEQLFLGRHKFLHYRVWYRDTLADYVKQILLDPLTLSRPYLERKSLETIVSSHLKGNRNYTTTIHKMLTLELLHRLFFDSTVHAQS
jgi:asparagine synthase (glutamine-hydrolysing)